MCTCVNMSVDVCKIGVHACLALGHTCVADSGPELLGTLPEMRAGGVTGPPPCPCPPRVGYSRPALNLPSFSSSHSHPQVPWTLSCHTCLEKVRVSLAQQSLRSQSASPPSGNITSPLGSLGLHPGLCHLLPSPNHISESLKEQRRRVKIKMP